MEKNKLKANKRKITGRKVKKLRKEGIIPANIYGKKIKSQAIEVTEQEFLAVYEKAGETGVIELLIEGKKHPVLIQNVQTHPINDVPLHVDFLQVDLKEKITTQVPIEIVGEAQACKDKIGTLLVVLNQVEVEALPQDLPEKIEVDVEKLAEVDQVIKVADIGKIQKVEIKTDANLDIVKVAPLVSKEAEQMAKEEEEMKEAAKEEKEGEEKKEEVKEGEEKKEEAPQQAQDSKSKEPESKKEQS